MPAGADAYLLSRVLHDWDDEDALRILRVCREAMSADARLLVVDAILPERAVDQPFAIRMDLHMLLLLGARERTEAEFRDAARAGRLRAGARDPDRLAGRPRRHRGVAQRDFAGGQRRLAAVGERDAQRAGVVDAGAGALAVLPLDRLAEQRVALAQRGERDRRLLAQPPLERFEELA